MSRSATPVVTWTRRYAYTVCTLRLASGQVHVTPRLECRFLTVTDPGEAVKIDRPVHPAHFPPSINLHTGTYVRTYVPTYLPYPL
ncbi:protein of unknown function [Taphrina deformans PYCC 5710]|uniref:Uncharacterized protein n=1 Tax=Taphrina deformans (strain PYCC 5710 / ATCC 11124 / CBS 356.35 / IMI 108563 / JCM 9778 / NBRC 8474) TaxID=1097556 RepID=R4XP21_TAPDE|nr:protein of unknown function [Taphrina deformans PYCC 5710]|eukprot:CCG85005.2 protein of unknown function [Taphrina deformans PYCC 5710]